MVFTEVPQALLFRIELNTNFVCAYIAQKTRIPVNKYNLQRLTEDIEDQANMVDLLKTPVINIGVLLRETLDRYEKEHPNGS